MKKVVAVPCPGGCIEYTSFRRAEQEGEGEADTPHTIPTMLKELNADDNMPYAVLLRDVQSTCVYGRIPVEGNAEESVYIPYRPMGRHG